MLSHWNKSISAINKYCFRSKHVIVYRIFWYFEKVAKYGWINILIHSVFLANSMQAIENLNRNDFLYHIVTLLITNGGNSPDSISKAY